MQTDAAFGVGILVCGRVPRRQKDSIFRVGILRTNDHVSSLVDTGYDVDDHDIIHDIALITVPMKVKDHFDWKVRFERI